LKTELVLLIWVLLTHNYIEMKLLAATQDLPTTRWIATDPRGFMKTALKQSPFTVGFDADDIGGWLKRLPPDFSLAIIWYYKMKPFLYSTDGAKLFERSILPGFEAKDRDAPRSWITVARRVLGSHVPPRSGSTKEIYQQIFDFLQMEEESALLTFVERASMLETDFDESLAAKQAELEIACFLE
jgi:hypothetical protein